MKKYIGTKEVTARPMSAELAISKGFKTSTYTGNDEGYEVIYKDGYSSWSPKSVFEESYKAIETPIDRMEIEFNELIDKVDKLTLFLKREDKEAIAGDKQCRLMEEQLHYMKAYVTVLMNRIELMKN